MILVARNSGTERWKTVRVAVTGGWGTTLRYALIVTLPPVMTLVGVFVVAAIK